MQEGELLFRTDSDEQVAQGIQGRVLLGQGALEVLILEAGHQSLVLRPVKRL